MSSSAVADELESPDGRKRRISQACLRCRGQKARCTGTMPCPRCQSARQECVFPECDRRKTRRRTRENPANVSGPIEPISVDLATSNLDQLAHAATSVSDPMMQGTSGAMEFIQTAGPSRTVHHSPSPAVMPPPSINHDTDTERLHMQYVRPFGPTAIQPGRELIHISMRASVESPASSYDPLLATLSPASPSPYLGIPRRRESLFALSETDAALFEEDSNLPLAAVSRPLVRLFFEHLGAHFPFLTPDVEAIHQMAVSRPDGTLLLNVMCALAARFSDDIRLVRPTSSPFAYGSPFADRAKQLLVHLLAWPTAFTTASALLLAWYSFGMNSESELWQYTGMALRMAVDLGLHKDLPHTAQDRLLFWCCFMMDRTLAIGTGRTVTVKDAEITISMPTEEDIDAVYAMAVPTPVVPRFRPSAFVFAIKQMSLIGRVAEVVNDGANLEQPAITEPPSRSEATDRPLRAQISEEEIAEGPLASIEEALSRAYNELPEALIWNTENLKAHMQANSATIYLHLHLWRAAMLVLLNRPPLLHRLATAAQMTLAARLEIVNHACRTVGEIIAIAEAIVPASIYANPFCGQPFFLCGCAAIQDYRIRTGKDALRDMRSAKPNNLSSLTNVLAHAALTNLKSCSRALSLQATYWAGIGWIAAVLEKRGLNKGRVSLNAVGQAVDTYVSLPELTVFRGLLRKMTGASPPESEAVLDKDSLAALFSAFSGDEDLLNTSFGADEFASTYSLAGIFPELALDLNMTDRPF